MPPPAFSLDEDGRGITIGGWRVATASAPIIGDAQVEAATRQLGGVLTVPEILFGNSGLTLTHAASGVALSFTALDALRAWRREDLPPLKVTVAQQWQAARREEIQRQQAQVLEYDWTYTTPYQGTVAAGGGAADGGATNGVADDGADGQLREICTSLEQQPQTPLAAVQALAAATSALEQQAFAAPGGIAAATRPPGAGAHHLPPPAAMTTTTTAAVAAGGAAGEAAAAHTPTTAAAPAAAPAPPPTSSSSSSPAALPVWRPTQRQADRALLLSRDEPILFFAEVPLYESELDDNGCSQLVAKVRVMPHCWLVLLRFWLRVDGSLVRLRETRLFCRFDKPAGRGVVLRETKHFEGTAAELRAAGAPVSATAYSDGDAAASVFNAIAPSCLVRYELHEMALAGGA
jgi:type 2A phosphatase activator TIP41